MCNMDGIISGLVIGSVGGFIGGILVWLVSLLREDCQLKKGKRKMY